MMKLLGFPLFALGVIVSACFAARAVSPAGSGPDGKVTGCDRVVAWGSVAGAPFALGVVMMVAGGLIARRQRRYVGGQGTEHEGGAPAGAADLALEGESGGMDRNVGAARPRTPRAIAEIVANKLEALSVEEISGDTKPLRDVLDEILESDVADFLTQRDALVAELGLSKFAEMIGHFAAMERNVARAWSALTDGANAEVPPCIERARTGVRLAREILG